MDVAAINTLLAAKLLRRSAIWSFLVLLLMLASHQAIAQAFSRVTVGAIATDSERSLGVAWGDYDADGYLDLFVANNGRNSLYRKNNEGTFTKVTSGPVATDQGDSRGSLWADYDNDGDLDLYVSNRGGNVPPPVTAPVQANYLYQNNGNGTFTKIADASPVTTENYTWSSSWVDYDNDGDLHMPDNLHAADDFFFENDGAGTFTSGMPAFIEQGSEPSTGVASWIDFDNDGDQDVLLVKSGRFLAAGAEDNRLFVNELAEEGNLRFQEITTGGIVSHFDNDFQASWADYDNDGDMDVFLGHAGGPRGVANYLYRNEGNGAFTRITTGPVVNDQNGTLGSGWGDYDNDGYIDLLVANGGADKLYHNNGDGTFTSMGSAAVGSIVATQANSWGAAWGDFNNDGFLDAIVINNGSPNFLYRNDLANGNHWINLALRGTASNRSAIGAKVYVEAIISGEVVRQVRHVSGSPTGDRSQNSLRVHFGLGDAIMIDVLRLEWSSGLVEEFFDVGVDAFLVAREGTAPSPVSSEKETDLPEQPFLSEVYPNPFHDSTVIRYTLPTSGYVRLHIVDLLGHTVLELVEAEQVAGQYQVPFIANGLPSGTYIHRLQTATFTHTRLMQLVK